MKLLDIINSIQKDIEDIDNINCGGCVQFAYFLSRKLKKYGYSHDVVIINSRYYSDNTEDILDKEACSHMVIYIPDIGYIDGLQICESVSDFGYDSPKYYTLSKDYDLNSLRKKNIWNDCYERRNNVKLKYKISKNFKKLKHAKKG